jgi:hypothetical protein
MVGFPAEAAEICPRWLVFLPGRLRFAHYANIIRHIGVVFAKSLFLAKISCIYTMNYLR